MFVLRERERESDAYSYPILLMQPECISDVMHIYVSRDRLCKPVGDKKLLQVSKVIDSSAAAFYVYTYIPERCIFFFFFSK